MPTEDSKGALASEDPLYDSDEAAAHLKLKSGKTLEVWRCTKRYDLEYIRVGRLIRYRKSALDKFLASRTVSGQANSGETQP